MIHLHIDQRIDLYSLSGVFLSEYPSVDAYCVEQTGLVKRQQQPASDARLRKIFLQSKQQLVQTRAVLSRDLHRVFLMRDVQHIYIWHFVALVEHRDNGYPRTAKLSEQLRAEFPGQRLEVIDSLCSSSGYGLLVDGAADLRDADKSMDETIDWVMAWRKRVHHQFYSTDLQYFRRGGRVSGPAATIGSILGICPIMRLDDRGRIIAYDKARGKKAAVRTTVDMMAAHAVGGTDYSGKCWICHSNCLEQAEITRDAVRARFPHVQEIRIFDIGTIIASHAGPGTVAVFFFGDERAPE